MRSPAAFLAGVALLVGGARGPRAAPRLTLELKGASLHETLRRVQQFYGWQASAPDEPGGARYLPPAAAPRASFLWTEAPVGKVFRDIARAFSVSPRLAQGDRLTVSPTPLREGGLSVARAGVRVSLLAVEQSETRTALLGSPNLEVAREAVLSLTLRSLEGDAEAFWRLENLRAQDDRGAPLRMKRGPAIWREPSALSRFPDEWSVNVPLEGLHPQARRLDWVEGEVVLYTSAPTYRVEVPLPLSPSGRAWSAGPVRLSLRAAERQGKRLSLRYDVHWQREANGITLAEGLEPSVRLPDGSLARLPKHQGDLSLDADGGLSTAGELSAWECPDEPVALVWDVVVKSGPERRVPFRLPGVSLPLVLEQGSRGALPPAGGATRPGMAALRLDLSTLRGEAGEVEVGLSRKLARGWGAVRWRAVPADDSGSAVVESLPPGTYRVRLQFRPRNAEGKLGTPAALRTAGEGMVTLVAGKTGGVTALR